MKRKFTLLMTLVVVLAISAFIVVQGQEAVEASECYTNCCVAYVIKYVPQNTSPRLVLDRYGNLTPENEFIATGKGVGGTFMIYTEKTPGAPVMCEIGISIEALTYLLKNQIQPLDIEGIYLEITPFFITCCDNMGRVWGFTGYHPVFVPGVGIIGYQRLYNWHCVGCWRLW